MRLAIVALERPRHLPIHELTFVVMGQSMGLFQLNIEMMEIMITEMGEIAIAKLRHSTSAMMGQIAVLIRASIFEVMVLTWHQLNLLIEMMEICLSMMDETHHAKLKKATPE